MQLHHNKSVTSLATRGSFIDLKRILFFMSSLWKLMYLFRSSILSSSCEVADKHYQGMSGATLTVPRFEAWGTPAGIFAEIGLSRLVFKKEKAPEHLMCRNGS
jgi:hypothetical protein